MLLGPAPSSIGVDTTLPTPILLHRNVDPKNPGAAQHSDRSARQRLITPGRWARGFGVFPLRGAGLRLGRCQVMVALSVVYFKSNHSRRKLTEDCDERSVQLARWAQGCR